MRTIMRLAALLLLPFCSGCSETVSVRRADPAPLLADQLNTRLVGDSISSTTRGALRELDLVDRARRDPLEAIGALIREGEADPGGAWRVAAAELLLDYSERPGIRDVTLDLACAAQADRQIRYAIEEGGGLLGSETEFAADLYHRAVSRVIVQVGARLAAGETLIELRGALGEWRLLVETPSASDRAMLDPGRFDELVPADTMRIAGLAARHRVDAYGSPVVAIREQARGDPPRSEAFVPPEGEILPATATIRFDDDRVGVLELWNPDLVGSVERHGGLLRLSSDVTAPIAELFARTRLSEEGRGGMLRADRYVDRIGVYLHEPYDPAKIPLLMVHGLRSSPITWRNMLNAVRGDPVLRARYQVWMFLYPTGLPVFRSASHLREELSRVCDHFDPEGDDPWRGRMVVVGHSMGGLLTKMLVQDPGDRLWASLTPESFEELDAPEDVRAHFSRVFFYRSNPDVSRVVFIATPHGGGMADSALGRLGDALVRLPGEFSPIDDWFATERRVRGASVDDSVYQVARGMPTSIDDLSPSSPHLRAIRELPLRAGVVAHAIIGDGGGDSDGVVPVASARFDGAVSELVVNAGHNAHEHPLAIREVRRILHEHLDRPTPGG